MGGLVVPRVEVGVVVFVFGQLEGREAEYRTGGKEGKEGMKEEGREDR